MRNRAAVARPQIVRKDAVNQSGVTMFCAVRNAVVGAMLTLVAGFSLPAQGAYTVTFSQSGGDVVASGGGTINLNGLTFITQGPTVPQVAPTFATEATGLA